MGLLKMRVVEVNQLGLTDKDIVEIKNFNDFAVLNKTFFRSKGVIYKLTSNYYLVGADIVFVYCKDGSVRI